MHHSTRHRCSFKNRHWITEQRQVVRLRGEHDADEERSVARLHPCQARGPEARTELLRRQPLADLEVHDLAQSRRRHAGRIARAPLNRLINACHSHDWASEQEPPPQIRGSRSRTQLLAARTSDLGHPRQFDALPRERRQRPRRRSKEQSRQNEPRDGRRVCAGFVHEEADAQERETREHVQSENDEQRPRAAVVCRRRTVSRGRHGGEGSSTAPLAGIVRTG